MSDRFSGRAAIVTGAASGIGRQTAMRLGEGGAHVTVADLRATPREGGISTQDYINEETAGTAQFVETDVSSVSDLQNVVDATVDEYGSLDILVNNAGMFPGEKSIHTIDADEFETVINTNTRSVFLGSKFATEVMQDQEDGGVIVNVSSLAGLFGLADASVYCTSKGGVSNLTRELAMEFGPDGIRVNAVNPGVIETPMVVEDSDVPQEMIDRIPIQSTGQPEEVAAVIAFLASDEASHVSGINMPVDGGLAANGY